MNSKVRTQLYFILFDLWLLSLTTLFEVILARGIPTSQGKMVLGNIKNLKSVNLL